ncbi:MAG: chromosome partitioning protein ParB, partial [Lachnospiraceae bacterium]|nr:chromosome partitioning protein ParB [Lachnospiraceae bacterium]
GHGRLLAAKRLGMETVPVIRLDHLTDEQRKAYALAHNKTAELSSWDFNILNEELASFGNINMEDFGFEPYKPPKEKEEKKDNKTCICPRCGAVVPR